MSSPSAPATRFPSLLLLLFLLLPLPGRAVEPLRTVGAIRALSPEVAATHLPVDVQGVVVYCNPKRLELVIHDGSDGIYVMLPWEQPTPRLWAGARLRIEGSTQPGDFIPNIASWRITALGEAPLPEPHRVVEGELFSPSLDCQWIEVPAVVVGAGPRGNAFTLSIEVSGRPITVKLAEDSAAAALASGVLQKPVIIRGVAGSVFNTQRQLTGRFLFVQSFDYIVPSESGPPAGSAPLREVDEVLRYGESPQSRVRVRGVVTEAGNDGLYLRGRGGGLLVRWTSATDLKIGEQVEAEGFAEVTPFRPEMRATHLRPLGTGGAPVPIALNLTAEGLLRQHADLVTVDAELLARRNAETGPRLLQCRAGNWVFDAIAPENVTLPAGLEPSAIIRLTGICELLTSHSLPPESPDGFRLHLRRAGDVLLLHDAPWWNLRRILWVAGLLGALAVASLAWVALLRRRVAEQTRIIAGQIERSVAGDERRRIARELHDTLEQDLAGTSAQLRTARRRLSQAPQEADGAMELAERMLDHCRIEARTSIRDLRSVTLEQRGLRGALEEFLPPIAAECGAQFRLHIEGRERSLSGATDVHLLRIAHQAVANAAQHAAPHHISVRLSYAAAAVRLEIRDDGAGFDPAQPARRGHFGILGMRERANKLRAEITIESAAGIGSCVRVNLPVPGETPS